MLNIKKRGKNESPIAVITNHFNTVKGILGIFGLIILIGSAYLLFFDFELWFYIWYYIYKMFGSISITLLIMSLLILPVGILRSRMRKNLKTTKFSITTEEIQFIGFGKEVFKIFWSNFDQIEVKMQETGQFSHKGVKIKIPIVNFVKTNEESSRILKLNDDYFTNSQLQAIKESLKDSANINGKEFISDKIPWEKANYDSADRWSSPIQPIDRVEVNDFDGFPLYEDHIEITEFNIFSKIIFEVTISRDEISFYLNDGLFLSINWKDINTVEVIPEIYTIPGDGGAYADHGYKIIFKGSQIEKEIRLWCCVLTRYKEADIIRYFKSFCILLNKEFVFQREIKNKFDINETKAIKHVYKQFKKRQKKEF